jgi:hypothetical protein
VAISASGIAKRSRMFMGTCLATSRKDVKARGATLKIEAQLATLRATFGKTAVTDLSKAEDDSALHTQDLKRPTAGARLSRAK